MTSVAVRKSKPGKAVPTLPPKARAPAVLAYLEASKSKLAALHEQVAVLALEAAEGGRGWPRAVDGAVLENPGRSNSRWTATPRRTNWRYASTSRHTRLGRRPPWPCRRIS